MERANLNDLKAVMAIAKRGTFRGAAIELGMSTTALSHAISKLEENLGVRLFNRTTRSVSLTEAGRLFVEQVGPALQDIHSALDIVRSQRETPSGTLRINAAAFAAREIISPVIIEFLRRYPEMNIDLVTEGKLVDIIADGFDLGIRVAHLVPSDMIAVSLGKLQRYVVVGSPEYLERYGKPKIPTDLFRHKCIRVRLPDGALFSWKFEKNGEIIQIDVQGPITLDEASLSRATVLENIGLGYFMEQDVRAEIESGQLISVLDDWMPCMSGLCLYYSGRRNQSAGLKAFLALVREVALCNE
ncbi:LysR family transcriptional regulator [Acinetobacter sp. AYS6]|jgi:DNA-binding transcriptional LysR family regulator|uniref:LysR family transcriptional regulator n=1 Tax=Acinetobacter TaxID=469 RepID=UPI00029CA89D|nr:MULTISPECIES: LysR family transcriptional regulator [Acinetobacter]EKU36974.1 LysR substrate-binding domain protein [Acinetobacter sp. WC-141]MBJ9418823.1 LysR family transcriptional regulator [Acinetobacter oleivorans]MBJ9739580.1 LysR family transcriptional regulator [Acinetobacter oleivorans]MBM7139278.1 LysR family transcriptional regulator [Acinetobacter sp. 105-3]MCU4410166.1 LysR family transcriptional regulator [Acinetobacter oleivorans]